MGKVKVKLPEHYNSIDNLPVINWDKLHTKKDFVYLLVKPQKLTRAQKIELSKVWTSLYDEYIKVFGFGDNFKEILKKRLLIANYKIQLIQTHDESINNFIRRQEKALEALMNLGKGGNDIFKAKLAIEQKFKFYIPMDKLTVREFYTYVRELNK